MSFTERMTALLFCFVCASVMASDQGRLESDPIFGGDVYVLETGDLSRPTLVLVHGLGDGASDDWRETIDTLRVDFHILAFDLPGFGRSSKANVVYSPTRYSELIHYLTEKYAKKPFHLVGHSMGGAIALRYAATYGEDLRSLTLIDAAGILHRLAYTKYLAPLGLEMFAGFSIPGRSSISDLAGVLLGSFERKLAETLPFDMSLVLHSGYLRQKLLKGNPTAIAGLGLVMEDYSRVPQQVQTPTLIVWGEDDHVAPPRTGLVLDALLPRSSLHIIPNAGHVPIREQLQEYIRLVRQHLNAPGSLSTRQPVETAEVRSEVVCDSQNDKTYSGIIHRLVLKNCQDILVENAEIQELVVEQSKVTIQNTVIEGTEIGIEAKHSRVMLTAGRVEADLPIMSVGSRFDIAGTRLNGRQNLVKAVGDSEILMSLVPVRSPRQADRVLHGQQPVVSTLTL
ncbi:MAG: alpha/beta hydrolase [Gammaproteobacteria bacterium]|nr:alpha/beta hydrolase [Gammaproteobacteria bacterium]